MESDATDLLIEITGERSVRAIALKAGFDPSTITRQIKAGIKAETLIGIARAYDNLEPVDLLVRFGFLTEAEALAAGAGVALAAATDEQLAQEILDRARRGTATDALTKPLDPADYPEPNVSGGTDDDLPHVGKVDVDALRRSGVALAADERAGMEEEQEQSQELP